MDTLEKVPDVHVRMAQEVFRAFWAACIFAVLSCQAGSDC